MVVIFLLSLSFFNDNNSDSNSALQSESAIKISKKVNSKQENLSKQTSDIHLFKNLEEAMPISLFEQNIIVHNSYILNYSEEDEQAYWVIYNIIPSLLDKSIARTNDFRADKMISSFSANHKDYKKSGYDRGHLKPSNASKTSKLDVSESFYYSNMSPQAPQFNRGVWKKLESKVVDFAHDCSNIIVVTGPVLENGLKKIGQNEVTVPNYYYKIILDNYYPNYKAIAFLLKNEKSKRPLQDFVVSIDSLESLLHIDFFPDLEDDIEDKLERYSDTSQWNFAKRKR